MSNRQVTIEPPVFLDHKPILEEMADSIMEYMVNLAPSKIAEILGISNQLAIKAHSLAYDFPNKLMGCRALYAFTGEAYRGLDVKTMGESAIINANNNLRIISSLYGILRPSDIIKPYRCEFNKNIGPLQQAPIKIFKPKVTVDLVNSIKDNKIKDVINLLPGDADKCIDWKVIRAFSKVHKICFQTITHEGKLKTPVTGRLKELRGIMARTIFEEGISSFSDLTQIKSNHFIFSPEDSKPGLPVFITT